MCANTRSSLLGCLFPGMNDGFKLVRDQILDGTFLIPMRNPEAAAREFEDFAEELIEELKTEATDTEVSLGRIMKLVAYAINNCEYPELAPFTRTRRKVLWCYLMFAPLAGLIFQDAKDDVDGQDLIQRSKEAVCATNTPVCDNDPLITKLINFTVIRWAVTKSFLKHSTGWSEKPVAGLFRDLVVGMDFFTEISSGIKSSPYKILNRGSDDLIRNTLCRFIEQQGHLVDPSGTGESDTTVFDRVSWVDMQGFDLMPFETPDLIGVNRMFRALVWETFYWHLQDYELVFRYCSHPHPQFTTWSGISGRKHLYDQLLQLMSEVVAFTICETVILNTDYGTTRLKTVDPELAFDTLAFAAAVILRSGYQHEDATCERIWELAIKHSGPPQKMLHESTRRVSWLRQGKPDIDHRYKKVDTGVYYPDSPYTAYYRRRQLEFKATSARDNLTRMKEILGLVWLNCKNAFAIRYVKTHSEYLKSQGILLKYDQTRQEMILIGTKKPDIPVIQITTRNFFCDGQFHIPVDSAVGLMTTPIVELGEHSQDVPAQIIFFREGKLHNEAIQDDHRLKGELEGIQLLEDMTDGDIPRI